MLKRPIPTRLTYSLQSEPMIVRIPQADPSLAINLHGNELIFDPPLPHIQASFRITGTARSWFQDRFVFSFGSKRAPILGPSLEQSNFCDRVQLYAQHFPG